MLAMRAVHWSALAHTAFAGHPALLNTGLGSAGPADWHMAYRFFALKHGSKMFHEGGIVGKSVTWHGTEQGLQRWKEGKTGLPLVDANMRELAQTGELGLGWRSQEREGLA